MTMIWIVPLALVLLTGLLYAEKKESLRWILLTKPFLSALFILTLLLQPHGCRALCPGYTASVGHRHEKLVRLLASWLVSDSI